MTNAHRNDGTWAPVIGWLDLLAHGRLFRVPFGTHPSITRRADGVLILHDTATGEALGECPIGDWVILGPDGFTAHHFDEPDA